MLRLNIKIVLFCFILLMLSQLSLIFPPSQISLTDIHQIPPDYLAVFPSSLQVVDEEAFAGTAFETVVFGNSLRSLGDRSFENASRLTHLYIPVSTEHIGESVLPGTVLLHGVDGSYAQAWAKGNGISFVIDDVWNVSGAFFGLHIENLLSLLWVICPADDKLLLQLSEIIKRFVKSMRPQDRPELYPINYRFP